MCYTNFDKVLFSGCHETTIVIFFFHIWSFHGIFLCSLFLSYFYVNRVMLRGKDGNVLNWWCIFSNRSFTLQNKQYLGCMMIDPNNVTRQTWDQNISTYRGADNEVLQW